ncbi:hypothetical protein ACLN6N_04010 [Sphingomonas carotinifaciens]|uniref:Uncharacterized protein n=1 Tax=Sphingomonas carotinifaciens TaxID=1166323 RepID=A0A1G7RKR7_9SPHN|nr:MULTISPECIES: hypothetical protein [Sphingomonas]MBB4085118.1 hypothetical protein [Sphingomonas carotinifaciens]MWC44496.1 hypothetical protein [Sphingomonas carotinifaciens]SDG11313.1 hypothetical protein SAMN05216557_1124 [Sphingomonas carotinifaciens]
MEWIKILALAAMVYGVWATYKALGTPVRYQGHRYFPQSDGTFKRWYGGRRFAPSEIGMADPG